MIEFGYWAVLDHSAYVLAVRAGRGVEVLVN